MPPSAAPLVSVIIPAKDDRDGVTACLDALASQVDAPPFEVLVVDNGSADGTADTAAGHSLRPRVLVENRPGSYAARNAGIRAARGEVLAFTDADCRPEPTWLAAALRQLSSSAVIGGRIAVEVSPHPTPWEVWDCAHYLDQEAYVRDGFAATANLLVRREVMTEVGPFDAALRSSGDLEWGKRATAAGHLFGYAADSVVWHRSRSSWRQTWRLHRRLGAGWRALHERGERPRARYEPFLRPSFDDVLHRATDRGLPVRRRALAVVHAVVTAARWTGWLTARG